MLGLLAVFWRTRFKYTILVTSMYSEKVIVSCALDRFRANPWKVGAVASPNTSVAGTVFAFTGFPLTSVTAEGKMER